MAPDMVRLTELSACAGCAGKMGSANLARALRGVAFPSDERVLVGFEGADDAGVYRLRDDLALVQTIDFFTPIVDDPFDYGCIAATNALSDVYAMGGTPISALNVVAFPEDLDLAILSRILEGGASVASRAGIVVLGGHSIKDDEPKYGMAVTGTIDPRRIVTNAGARPGDTLLLTKPLGTGILTTARKRGAISDAQLAPAIAWMTQLNAAASRAMLAAGAHAATDVTGFGLLGHANEMARASHMQIVIDATAVPFMANVTDLIDRGVVPGGTRDNEAAHAAHTTFAASVTPCVRTGLSDAQTSGGLLIAAPPENLASLRRDLEAGNALGAVIGEVRSGTGIVVR